MEKDSFKMPLIETREQLLENIDTLKTYLLGDDKSKNEFAIEKIQNGRVFFVVQHEGYFSFYPSRFIGYQKNSKIKHEQANVKELLDGKKTNPQISKILCKKNVYNAKIEEEYKKFCQRIGIIKISKNKRSYWILDELEMAISNTIGSTNNIIQSFEEDKKNHISTAEKEQIVKSRIGQSVIRNKLLFLKKHCELCSIKQEELLVASHIKPWAESDNFERGDKDNLLLLCAMHDALFDKGFISFDEEGKILISEEIKRDELEKYMLYENMKISVDDTKKKYLSFHRENIFRK